MDPTPMPDALRRVILQRASEAIVDIRDVLRYGEPNVTRDARRMTLYRATDAADIMNEIALLIAALWQTEGASESTLQRYLQTDQQRDRGPGPQAQDRAELAALLAPSEDAVDDPSLRVLRVMADAAADGPRHLSTLACVYGLHARLHDDVEALDDYLPPQVAAMARKVAEVLEEPRPAVV
ncbi:hypothetical protein OG948_01200 [Embleya sp. NBC_00888]|uniref:hypothetical protein n=1 Tax=Embleya sp. NBC_00888 TaxID=2975960 RepID=UPI003868D9DF|nr:hypothetical protein OG948_01200 [Embleya sp. NBC_00888]